MKDVVVAVVVVVLGVSVIATNPVGAYLHHNVMSIQNQSENHLSEIVSPLSHCDRSQRKRDPMRPKSHTDTIIKTIIASNNSKLKRVPCKIPVSHRRNN